MTKEKLEKRTLSESEALGSLPFSLGSDLKYKPVFPSTREDVCAVRRIQGDGSTYGSDLTYLIWKDKGYKIHHRVLTSCSRCDYFLDVKEVLEDKDEIVVKVGADWVHCGQPFERVLHIPKSDLEID